MDSLHWVVAVFGRFLGQSNSVYARDVDEQNDQQGYKEGIRKSVHGES